MMNKITANVHFSEFLICIQTVNDGKKIVYDVEEKMTRGWQKVPENAAQYIINDFKRTSEYKKISDTIDNIIKNYCN